MRLSTTVAAALGLCCLLATSNAMAGEWDDSRPTSGDPSLYSGRTLGVGQTAIAAGAGWPGAYGEIAYGVSSILNLGLRAEFLYGSPLMGFGSGLGFEASVPTRYHIYGSGQLDLAVAFRPAFLLGEGGTVGQTGTFSDNFGWGLYADFGLLLGYQLDSVFTLTGGAFGSLGFVATGDAPNDSAAFGRLFLSAGIEALISSATFLFADTRFGFGFAPDNLFSSKGLFQIAVGVGHQL